MPRIPLLAIFAIQVVIVAVSLSVLTAILATSAKNSTDSNVRTLAMNRLESNRQKILNPLWKYVAPVQNWASVINANVHEPLVCTSRSTRPELVRVFVELERYMVNDPAIFFAYHAYRLDRLTPAGDSFYWGQCTCALSVCAYTNYNYTEYYRPRLPMNASSIRLLGTDDWHPTYEHYIQEFIGTIRPDESGGRWTGMDVWPWGDRSVPLMSFYVPYSFDAQGNCTGALGLDVNIENVVDILRDEIPSTPGSTVALYELNSQQLLASNAPFPGFDNATGLAYPMDATPDPLLNRAFAHVMATCPETTCNTTVIDFEDYVLSAVRVREEYNMNMLMLELTPRSHYYRDGERSRNAGIILCVVVIVIIIASCIIIWIAISNSLKDLQEEMKLAAVMRNDQVQPQSSVIMEVDNMAREFNQMNSQLLAARPFMPRSLLCQNDTDDEEEPLLDIVPAATEDGRSVQSGLSHGKYTQASVRAAAETESRHSSRRAAMAHGALKTTTSVTSKYCAVMYVNFTGFHLLLKAHSTKSSQTFCDKYHHLVTMVESAVNAHRGVVDYFHGDRFVITFGAAKLCGSPLTKAAQTAIAIRDIAAGMEFIQGVSIGIDAGGMTLGNIGSTSLMKFSTVGHQFSRAIYLESVARGLCHANNAAATPSADRSLILIPKGCIGELSIAFHLAPIGVAPASPNGDGVDAVAAYTIVAPVASGGDEWLYEVNSGADDGPLAGYTEAMEAIFSGRRDKATQLLQAHRNAPESEAKRASSSGAETAENQMARQVIRCWDRVERILLSGSDEWKLQPYRCCPVE